jgi:hypothetical protein
MTKYDHADDALYLMESKPVSNDAMKEIWLLEDKELPEDADCRIIWSADSDCEEINDGYKIIGHYVLYNKQDNTAALDALDKLKPWSTLPEDVQDDMNTAIETIRKAIGGV